MKRYPWVWVCVLLGLICFGNTDAVYADNVVQVSVSIVPQKYFVEKIGGDRVRTVVMVPPGAEPADYEPKPQQVVALAASRIYFAIGVPFETVWLKKFRAVNPGMLLVHTEAGIARLSMAGHLPAEVSGKPDAAAQGRSRSSTAEGMPDPHVWLSPPLVMIQARNILRALVRVDPAHKDYYEANYLRFIGQAAELDMKIANIFWGPQSVTRKPFISFHPAWGYFAAAYGLRQIPVQLAGNEPTARELHKLIGFARAKGIKVVFVEPEFSTRSARVIARDIGGRVVAADPLAGDWAKNLLAVAREMESATRQETK